MAHVLRLCALVGRLGADEATRVRRHHVCIGFGALLDVRCDVQEILRLCLGLACCSQLRNVLVALAASA